MQAISTFSRFLKGNDDKRVLVVYGGAGSGKSVAVAQHLCRMFLTHENLKILVIRKTLPALRITAFALIKDTLRSWGMPLSDWLNKTERTIDDGRSQILFNGLDDPEKVKSFDANVIWVEEATELTIDDFRQLNLRLRRPHPKVANQIFLTFNPIDAFHWCITELVQSNDPNVAVHHSTYKDNPFLPPAYVQQLIGLEQKDRNFYRIYTLGEPGILENVIYSNYVVEDESQWPLAVRESPPQFYGQDYGTVNSMAMVAGWLYEGEYYLRELLYRTGMTGMDLIEWMRSENIPRGPPIVGDSARPDLIEDQGREGWNVVPCEKGAGSVKAGIDYLKGHRLHISSDSANMVKEIRAYKWRERDGHPIEEPVDFMDHLMDASRYPIFTLRPKTSSITESAIPIERSVGGTRAYDPSNQARSRWGRR